MQPRWIAVAWLACLACDRGSAPAESSSAARAPAPITAATTAPSPVLSAPIDGDARATLRAVFGAPTNAGREIGSIEPATNADPQVDAAGVLVATVGGGRVVTVWEADGALHVGGPFDLGTARFVATDGPHVCAADRESMRCAWIDGSDATPRPLVGGTTGLWGGPGVLLRGVGAGASWGLRASSDGFLHERAVSAPQRTMVADLEVETTDHWSAVTTAIEGTAKPRLALSTDGGKTPISDFGSLDRVGWSYGDRLWPNLLVTGALSTELVVAGHGEKQRELKLPWSAVGGFPWTKNALVLFGRGTTGSGGFMLVEVDSNRVTSFTPPGGRVIIAAGRVGASVVAIDVGGKVLAWP